MFQIPSVSRDSYMGIHSHLPSPAHHAIFLAICMAIWWWKPSITISIAPVTTHISLQYSNTSWTTALYIIVCACTTAPNFVSTFSTIHRRRQAFLRFWYRWTQFLLLYATVCSSYWKYDVVSIGSDFTLMTTLLDSKQCWRKYPFFNFHMEPVQ